jgi:hypothetical protein
MQGHSNDETNKELLEPTQLLSIPDKPCPLEPPVKEDNQNDPEHLMNISVAAYNGCPTEPTIALLLQLAKSSAIALADTGSTNTFIDLQFAIKHNIALTSTTPRKVKVAGGGLLNSQLMAYNCPLSIQGQQFTADFRILELQGFDVILGVNLFKMYNPVTFDFCDQTPYYRHSW